MSHSPLLAPRRGVARSPLNQRLSEKAGISEVDCVVRSLGREDQVLRIEDRFLLLNKVLGCHRVEVMNQSVIADLVARDAEIAPVVADNNEVASIPPLA